MHTSGYYNNQGISEGLGFFFYSVEWDGKGVTLAFGVLALFTFSSGVLSILYENYVSTYLPYSGNYVYGEKTGGIKMIVQDFLDLIC